MHVRALEYFLILGDSPIRVVAKFPPKDHVDAPISSMLDTLPAFGFPDSSFVPLEEALKRSPRFITFVITSPTYQCFYISCLQIHEYSGTVENDEKMYALKVFCLVSLHPYLQTCQSALEAILHIVVESRNQGNDCIAATSAIQHLLNEVPLPPSMQRSQTVFSVGSFNLSILEGSFARDFSFRPLFATLSIEKITQLFFLVLTERKVALITHRPALILIYICEIIRALMYPFQWHHVYAPLLPRGMWAALECPVPFLIGIHFDESVDAAVARKALPSQIPSDVVMFDLDLHTVTPAQPDIHVPPGIMDLVKRRLPDKYYHAAEIRPTSKEYWRNFGHTFVQDASAVQTPASRTDNAAGAGPDSAEDTVPQLASHNLALKSKSVDKSYWSESAENRYRCKVQAAFLEVLAVLFYDYRDFLGSSAFPTRKFLNSRLEWSSDVRGFFEAFVQTNTWEHFLSTVVESENARYEPFEYATSLVCAMCNPKKQLTSDDLHVQLEGYVGLLYEPEYTIIAPLPMMVYPVEIGSLHREILTFPKLPDIQSPSGPFLRGPVTGVVSSSPRQLHPRQQLPRDLPKMFHTAWRHFRAGHIPNSLFVRVLRSISGEESRSVVWKRAYLRSLPRESRELTKRLLTGPSRGVPASVVNQPEPFGHTSRFSLRRAQSSGANSRASIHPELRHLYFDNVEMDEANTWRVTAHLSDFADLTDACATCQWKCSFWDVLGQVVSLSRRKQAPLDENKMVTCRACGDRWTPRFTVALRGPVARRTDQRVFSYRALNDIHDRLESERLVDCPLANLDPDIYWNILLFFGIHVDLYVAPNSALSSLASTGGKMYSDKKVARARETPWTRLGSCSMLELTRYYVDMIRKCTEECLGDEDALSTARADEADDEKDKLPSEEKITARREFTHKRARSSGSKHREWGESATAFDATYVQKPARESEGRRSKGICLPESLRDSISSSSSAGSEDSAPMGQMGGRAVMESFLHNDPKDIVAAARASGVFFKSQTEEFLKQALSSGSDNGRKEAPATRKRKGDHHSAAPMSSSTKGAVAGARKASDRHIARDDEDKRLQNVPSSTFSIVNLIKGINRAASPRQKEVPGASASFTSEQRAVKEMTFNVGGIVKRTVFNLSNYHSIPSRSQSPVNPSRVNRVITIDLTKRHPAEELHQQHTTSASSTQGVRKLDKARTTNVSRSRASSFTVDSSRCATIQDKQLLSATYRPTWKRGLQSRIYRESVCQRDWETQLNAELQYLDVELKKRGFDPNKSVSSPRTASSSDSPSTPKTMNLDVRVASSRERTLCDKSESPRSLEPHTTVTREATIVRRPEVNGQRVKEESSEYDSEEEEEKEPIVYISKAYNEEQVDDEYVDVIEPDAGLMAFDDPLGSLWCRGTESVPGSVEDAQPYMSPSIPQYFPQRKPPKSRKK